MKREELVELRMQAEAAVLGMIVNNVSTTSSSGIVEWAQAVALLRTKPESVRSGSGTVVAL